MKKILSALLALSIQFSVFSQQLDFNKVVVPIDSRARTFEDFLVQLAWMNNPENNVLAKEVDIAKVELKIQKWEWTDNLEALLNYNEAHFIKDFQIGGSETQNDPIIQSLIYPRFNFGARIPLGTILNHKKEKRIKEIKIGISEDNLNQKKLEIRAKTLERYQDYLLSKEILTNRTQAQEETSQTYQLMSSLFNNGQAKLDEYNSASTAYFNSKEQTLKAKSEVAIAKIKLEEMIGISLEDAERYKPKEKKKRAKK